MWIIYKQLKDQVEFYFYNPKLAEDFFLRRNMDSRGYVDLNKIAGFDQVAKITQGLQNIVGLLIQALQPSELLELSTDRKCVRRKFSPEKWILGSDPSVFSSLRPDAPEFVFELAGLKKNAKEDDDQCNDAEQIEKETTSATVAQNTDLNKKSAEIPTGLSQKADSLEVAATSEESSEPVDAAATTPGAQLTDADSSVENSGSVKDSERKCSESSESSGNI